MNNIYRLGVIADTHLTTLASGIALAHQLLEGPFSGIDLILHAGDMVIPELESCFGDIPVYSIRGNMDRSRRGLPLRRIIEIAGYRIGLIHGWGPPAAVPHNVHNEFAEDHLNLVVFGHSHTPYHAIVGGTLLFNPGSATDHRGHAESCSVGLIDLGPELIARHVPFQLDLDPQSDSVNN